MREIPNKHNVMTSQWRDTVEERTRSRSSVIDDDDHYRDLVRAVTTGFRGAIAHNIGALKRISVEAERSLAETRRAIDALGHVRSLLEINEFVRGGVPVLRGSNITIAQILAELADDQKVSDLAKEFDLDREYISELLHSIAVYLDHPRNK